VNRSDNNYIQLIHTVHKAAHGTNFNNYYSMPLSIMVFLYKSTVLDFF